MKSLLVTAVASFAIGVLVSSALAETEVLARSGNWEAFGGTTDTGRPLCGISAEVEGRYFGLKLFSGNDTFTVQMGTSEWKLDDGTEIELTMHYDTNLPWRATGTVMHFSDGDAGLEFRIKRDELERFQEEFRTTSELQVKFNDVLPNWQFSLQGAGELDGALQTCIKNLP